jgi:hypothetical protein
VLPESFNILNLFAHLFYENLERYGDAGRIQ